MPSAWGHTRLLETDWRLITQESHCFSCGSVKDQVSGKKPERINSKKKISYDAPVQEDPQVTMEREVLRSRSVQHVLGPK